LVLEYPWIIKTANSRVWNDRTATLEFVASKSDVEKYNTSYGCMIYGFNDTISIARAVIHASKTRTVMLHAVMKWEVSRKITTGSSVKIGPLANINTNGINMNKGAYFYGPPRTFHLRSLNISMRFLKKIRFFFFFEASSFTRFYHTPTPFFSFLWVFWGQNTHKNEKKGVGVW